MLRDKEAVSILFDDIAPRFADRPGGFTRILRLAKPRLGDAGTRAFLEFVGENDRDKRKEAARPTFVDDSTTAGAEDEAEEAAAATAETEAAPTEADDEPKAAAEQQPTAEAETADDDEAKS